MTIDSNPKVTWLNLLEFTNNGRGRQVKMIQEFLLLIDKNFKKEHHVGFYAKKLEMPITEDYLRKVCKKTLQLSPGDCIQIRLMLEACELLKNTNSSIFQISESLGYEQTYFSRIFKKLIGIVPREFRDNPCF